MAKQTIGIGSAANDGTGSTLRAAFDICNDNFTELYDGSGGLLHKIEGTNFTGSLLVGHSTTGTLDNAFYNTALGIGALDALTTGDTNVAVGYNAGTSINSGETNVVIGAYAGDAITTGDRNVAIGYQALSAEDTGHRNVAVGYNALSVQNYGDNNYNVAIGYAAGLSVTSGLQNTIIGGLAGDALDTGSNNVALGYKALSAEDGHNNNVAVGSQALMVLNAGNTGNNVAVGLNAGVSVSTGIKNTILGSKAGDLLETGENNTIIGYNAEASSTSVSNEITFGDSNIANVRIPSDSTLKIGASGDLQLEHVSSNSFIKNTAVGDLYIENQVDDADIIFRSDDGSGGLETYLSLDGSDRVVRPGRSFVFPDNISANFGAGYDLNIKHDGSNSKLENNTGHLYINNEATDKDIIFQSDDGSGSTATYFTIDGSDVRCLFSVNAEFSDNVKAKFGTSDDLEIYHDGSHSYIHQKQTGNLYIQQSVDDGDIIFQSDDGSGGTETYFFLDGSASSGNPFTVFPDNAELAFGDSRDFRIKHTGDSYLSNTSGGMYLRQQVTDGDMFFQADDGSGGTTTYLSLDGGAEKILMHKSTVFSGGGMDYGVDGTGADVIFYGDTSGRDMKWDQSEDHLLFKDNTKLKLGTSGDLEIYHDGSNSYIKDGGTGDLRIWADSPNISTASGNKIFFGNNGAAELYYTGGVKKFETTNTGADVTGTLNLDNLTVDSAQGSDGQVLTSTGSGIAWEDASGGGISGKVEGTNFTDSIIVGHTTTGTLDSALRNTALGLDSMDAITSGDDNTFIGYKTGTAITTGSFNVGIGTEALKSEDAGGRNVAVGGYALTTLNGETAGHNVAVGYESGILLSNGQYNILVGSYAGDSLTTADKNIAIGHEALSSANNAVANLIGIGYQAGMSASAGSNIHIGAESGKSNTGNGRIDVGLKSGYSNTSGGYNTNIGYFAGYANTTNSNRTIIGGETALYNTGANNTIIGYQAAYGASGSSTGDKSTIIGYYAGRAITSGDSNVLIGYNAGLALTVADDNVFIGNNAGDAFNNTDGDGRNVAVGNESAGALTTGIYNTFLGYGAGNSAGGTSATVTTGNFNTMVGYQAKGSATSASNQNSFGYSAACTGNNQVTLGDTNIGTIRAAVTSITAISDERDKTDIETLPYGLDFVDSLQPKKFVWDNRAETDGDGNEFFSANKGKKDIGFIAQELQTVDDDYLNLVYDADPEKLEATYGRLIPVLVKAIQDLSAKVKALENA